MYYYFMVIFKKPFNTISSIHAHESTNTALFAHLHFPTITHRIIMVCSKKYRDKCKPHNTRGVHREPNVLRLVEVGGDLPV